MDPDSYLCRLADLFDGVVVTPPSVGAVIAIVLAVVLLFASGFVSASEIAFFSLTPNDLNDIEEENPLEKEDGEKDGHDQTQTSDNQTEEKEDVFKCPGCGKVFESEKGLKSHLRYCDKA